jgi:hypothetical protein
MECYKYCLPTLFSLSLHDLQHLTTHRQLYTNTSQATCSSLPLSSLSPPALPSSGPRPILPFVEAAWHSAASLTSLILLPLPARTVSAILEFLAPIMLTINPAVGSPQTIEEFDATCATLGVTAQCCVLPIVSFFPSSRLRANADSNTAWSGPSLRFSIEGDSFFFSDI